MATPDGVDIVLTPIQLAAIIENESIDQSELLANRLWGAAALAGGAIELVGAAALLLETEPTAVTKIAGGALGAHGLDTASAAILQIVSGRTRTTMTATAVTSAAEALGVDPQTAASVGMAVDMTVPMIIGFAGAARVIAIRKGAMSLVAEEAAGGHTLQRHVGRTVAQLRARLSAETRIPVASTFRTLDDAERFTAFALRANKSIIKEWAKTALPGQTKALTYNAGRVVGEGVLRSTGRLETMTNVVVVVRKVQEQNRIYFVLTSYPKP